MWFNSTICTQFIDEALNWTFLKAIKLDSLDVFSTTLISRRPQGVKGSQDFVGINYYAREFIKFSFSEHST